MKIKLIFTISLLTVLMAACGSPNTPAPEPTPDIAAVRTSAASTVISQFTLTAAAFTPTPALPTETSAPPSEGTGTATSTTATVTTPFAQVTNASGTSIALCDLLSYDPATVDVNVPDNT